MIERVKFRFSNRFLFLRHDDPDIEILFLMSGCHRTCTSQALKPIGIPHCLVTGVNDFDTLMEPHGQSPWYLHRIPSYTPGRRSLLRSASAKASEGYPPSAKSAEALILETMYHSDIVYTFIHGLSPCLHAEVPAFVETFRAGVSARRRGLLRWRINWLKSLNQKGDF